MGEKCLFHTAAQTDIQTNSQPGRQAGKQSEVELVSGFQFKKKHVAEKSYVYSSRTFLSGGKPVFGRGNSRFRSARSLCQIRNVWLGSTKPNSCRLANVCFDA